MQNTLSIRDLSVHYRTERGLLQALRHVDLDIPAHSIVGIVGESGCGKSTLSAAILRLLPDNARIPNGRIEFEGEDLLQFTAAQMRAVRGARMSIVFQDPMSTLNPALRIGRQMTDIQYRDGIGAAQKKRRSLGMLESVGMADPRARFAQYPHHFSGGMKQRISIAMALQARPALLIADEPTTALDATLEVQIIRLLKELQRDLGCSILFISHHLGVIAELCERVVVMYAGEVVEEGAVGDVFRRPAHPYTERLLACDPARIKQKTRQLPTIAGEIPDLVELGGGCVFRARCAERAEVCDSRRPAWVEVAPQQNARCHHREAHTD
ncbi:MAG: ABC transporter ATP-binding protein [Gammaproteobacteria bacterium]